MRQYFIGTDPGLFEGDIQSLCVIHQGDGVIVIDGSFQTMDEKEFEKKVDELCEKYHFAPLPTPKIKSKSDRILNLSNLLKTKKIKLTSEDLKYFQ